MAAQDVEHMQQQIAEIAGVECLQPLLIEPIELLPATIGIGFVLDRIEIAGVEPAVLPAIEQTGELARRPAFLVELGFADQLLDQPQLIVGVDDGVIALEPDQLGMTAQHLRADRVEGAEPRHALDRIADVAADPLAHLARGLVGEGDAQDFARPGARRRDQMRKAGGERGGLARACPGQHQHRTFGRQHGIALGLVEPLRIGRNRTAGRGRDGKGRLRHGDVVEQLGNSHQSCKPCDQSF